MHPLLPRGRQILSRGRGEGNEMRISVKFPHGDRQRIEARDVDHTTGVPALSEFILALHGDTAAEPCPGCGQTLAEAVRTSLFGCGLCYSTLYPGYAEAAAKLQAAQNSGLAGSE